MFGAGNAFGVVQFALTVSPAKYFDLSVIRIGWWAGSSETQNLFTRHIIMHKSLSESQHWL